MEKMKTVRKECTGVKSTDVKSTDVKYTDVNSTGVKSTGVNGPVISGTAGFSYISEKGGRDKFNLNGVSVQIKDDTPIGNYNFEVFAGELGDVLGRGINHNDETGGPVPSSFEIAQANTMVPFVLGSTVMLGLFQTDVGYEMNNPIYNPLTSYSRAFDETTMSHVGVKFSMPLNDDISAQISVVNDTRFGIINKDEGSMALGMGINWNPSAFAVNMRYAAVLNAGPTNNERDVHSVSVDLPLPYLGAHYAISFDHVKTDTDNKDTDLFTHYLSAQLTTRSKVAVRVEHGELHGAAVTGDADLQDGIFAADERDVEGILDLTLAVEYQLTDSAAVSLEYQNRKDDGDGAALSSRNGEDVFTLNLHSTF